MVETADYCYPPSGRIIAIRSVLISGLRVLCTAALLWALATRLDLGRAAQLVVQASFPLVAANLAVLAAAMCVVAFRWHVILCANAWSPGRRSLILLVFVGAFFNQVLPTGVGGDAVRAWRCSKLGMGLGRSIISILIDRACGYVVLLVIYLMALPGLLELLPAARDKGVVSAGLIAGLLGLLGLVSVDYLPLPLRRIRAIALLAELSRESRRLFADPRRAGVLFGLSTVTMALTIVAFKLIAEAIGTHLPLRSWAMIVPPVTLIQLLPVSLAGWGVREVALVVMLGAFGVAAEAALAISILSGICMILVGLPGGLIWLADLDVSEPRQRNRVPP